MKTFCPFATASGKRISITYRSVIHVFIEIISEWIACQCIWEATYITFQELQCSIRYMKYCSTYSAVNIKMDMSKSAFLARVTIFYAFFQYF
jgi:hypothetical protein